MTEMGHYMDVSVQPARKVSNLWHMLKMESSSLFSDCTFPYTTFSKCPLKKWHCLRKDGSKGFSARRCELSESTAFAHRIHLTTLHQSALIWRWVGLCWRKNILMWSEFERTSCIISVHLIQGNIFFLYSNWSDLLRSQDQCMYLFILPKKCSSIYSSEVIKRLQFICICIVRPFFFLTLKFSPALLSWPLFFNSSASTCSELHLVSTCCFCMQTDAKYTVLIITNV